MRLRLDGVTAGYAGTTVFADLSFEAAAGTVVILTGPNGVGKTTLLRTIAGFVAPERGAIILDSGDPEQNVGMQAHMVGHLNALKQRLTVTENLSDWNRILGGQPAELESALAMFDLDHLAGFPVAYLSAGQKRRTALARLLVAMRPLWLLDEPTTALDTANSALVSTVIAHHAANGGIVFAATHMPLGIPGATTLDLTRYAARHADHTTAEDVRGGAAP